MEASRGGSIPATKIGEREEYGNLTVYRNLNGTRFCGPASPNSAPIVPSGVNGPTCRASIPTHSFVDTSVDLKIGGMAAVISGSAAPRIAVYVNGTEVPAAALGDEFTAQCPFEGTAFAEGATLARYNCSLGSFNWARIPLSYFQGGLNTITVNFTMLEAAFANWGNDIDTRIIVVQ